MGWGEIRTGFFRAFAAVGAALLVPLAAKALTPNELQSRFALSDAEIQSRCQSSKRPDACREAYERLRDQTNHFLAEQNRAVQSIQSFQQKNHCAENATQSACAQAAQQLAALSQQTHAHLADIAYDAADAAGQRDSSGSSSGAPGDVTGDAGSPGNSAFGHSHQKDAPGNSAFGHEQYQNGEGHGGDGGGDSSSLSYSSGGDNGGTSSSRSSSLDGEGATGSGCGPNDPYTAALGDTQLFQDTMNATGDMHTEMAKAEPAAPGAQPAQPGPGTASLASGNPTGVSPVVFVSAQPGSPAGASSAAPVADPSSIAAAPPPATTASGTDGAAPDRQPASTAAAAPVESSDGGGSMLPSLAQGSPSADPADKSGAKPTDPKLMDSNALLGAWDRAMGSPRLRGEFVDRMASNESYRRAVNNRLRESLAAGKVNQPTAEFVRAAVAEAARQAAANRELAGLKPGSGKDAPFAMDPKETQGALAHLLAQNNDDQEQESYLASPTEPLFNRVHGTIARMLREGHVKRPKLLR